MTNPSTLIQQHAGAIIATLVDTLHAPDPRAKLEAAKLLLLWGWGRPGAPREEEAGPPGRLSHAKMARAIELLMPHLEPDRKQPEAAATACPARHADARPPRPEVAPTPIGANPDINPMSRERGVSAPAATAPSGSAPEAMSPEPVASPLAAPVGAESPRRDADPMSRRLLPRGHSADDPFRRPLPQPPPMEPPGFYADQRRRRWPPWR